MPWKKLYESCVSETNPDKLKKLVFRLEEAIVLRYHDLANEPNALEELQAIKRAAQQVLQLKIERLGWPNPAIAGASAIPAAMPISMPAVILPPPPSADHFNELATFDAPKRSFAGRIQSAILTTQRAWQNWVFKSLK